MIITEAREIKVAANCHLALIIHGWTVHIAGR
jgi:hypothetical protein